MLSLARTSLSLSRILLRTSFTKINYSRIRPIRRMITNNLMFVSFYSNGRNKRYNILNKTPVQIERESIADRVAKVKIGNTPEKVSAASTFDEEKAEKLEDASVGTTFNEEKTEKPKEISMASRAAKVKIGSKPECISVTSTFNKEKTEKPEEISVATTFNEEKTEVPEEISVASTVDESKEENKPEKISMFNQKDVAKEQISTTSVGSEAKTDKSKPEQISVSPSLNSTIISTVTQAESSKKEDTNTKEDDNNSWQTMKYTFTIFGVTFTAMGVFLLVEFGRPPTNEQGFVIEDEFSHMPVPMQYIHRTIRQLNYYRKLINEPSRDKLLPDVLKYPYHQPPYTLILEFKDVLVHPDWTYNTGWRFKKRPGLDQFLEQLSGVYEIVIYTAELGMTVFPILEALDPNNLITYKLVRDATNFIDGHHVKDLDKLNRSLEKVIVIDWDADSVQLNQDNVLKIPRWDGSDSDTTLLDLANFLRVIAMSEIEDVRDVLRHYREFEDPIAAFREKQRELERTMYNKNKK